MIDNAGRRTERDTRQKKSASWPGDVKLGLMRLCFLHNSIPEGRWGHDISVASEYQPETVG